MVDSEFFARSDTDLFFLVLRSFSIGSDIEVKLVILTLGIMKNLCLASILFLFSLAPVQGTYDVWM